MAKLDAELSDILAATFLGGNNVEGARALAFDGMGGIFVAGTTSSPDFPGVGPGSADSDFSNGEAFVAKLDGELSTILAATFLGGSGGEDFAPRTTALALDSAGDVYVTGRNTESSDFPGVGPGSADNTFQFREAFVAKLDAELSTILAATFLGGSDNDETSALTLDNTGNVFVAGITSSPNFPGVGPGSADNSLDIHGEAFVTKLDPNLSGPPEAPCTNPVATVGCKVNGVMGRRCEGTPGNDTIFSGPTADVILGNGGDDLVLAGAGDDLVCTLGGNDQVAGGGDNDIVSTGEGDDLLKGQKGDDRLDGGDGTDKVVGGDGTDTCVNGETLFSCE